MIKSFKNRGRLGFEGVESFFSFYRLYISLVLSFVMFTSVSSVFSQTANTKRVLVIPTSEFEFTTEFPLQEMADFNQVGASQVFLTYEKALLKAFSFFENENYDFVTVDAQAFEPYKKKIRYVYGKVNKRHFNGVDLKQFSDADFKDFLTFYHADYVIFITRYFVRKESLAPKGNVLKISSYAGHYIDFSIVNSSKEQISGKGKVKVKSLNAPNDFELSLKFLRVDEVALGYPKFIREVIMEIDRGRKEE